MPIPRRQARLAPVEPSPAGPRPRADGPRPRVDGKFLAVGEERLWLAGVTYGTFAPGEDGQPYPDRARADADLRAMAANGIDAALLGFRVGNENLREHGLERAWTVALRSGGQAGTPRPRVRRVVQDADLLINVIGFCTDEELGGAAHHRWELEPYYYEPAYNAHAAEELLRLAGPVLAR